MSRVLQVSTSGFMHGASVVKVSESREPNLLAQIKAIHMESRCSYGPLHVYDAFKDRGAVCGRRRVARLIRQHGIHVPSKSGTTK